MRNGSYEWSGLSLGIDLPGPVEGHWGGEGRSLLLCLGVCCGCCSFVALKILGVFQVRLVLIKGRLLFFTKPLIRSQTKEEDHKKKKEEEEEERGLIKRSKVSARAFGRRFVRGLHEAGEGFLAGLFLVVVRGLHQRIQWCR